MEEAERTDESADDITAADTAPSPKKATNLNMNISEWTISFNMNKGSIVVTLNIADRME